MLEPVTQPLVLQTLLLATRTMTPLLMALQPATLLVALLLLVRLTTMPLLLVQGLSEPVWCFRRFYRYIGYDRQR